MSTTAWRAPAAGDTASASDIAQLQTTHPATFLYQGSSQETGAVSTTGTLNTNTGSAAQWIAQPFSTGGSQTTITRVELNFTAVGTGADLTITLQTDNSGSPSGTILATVTFPADFEPGSATTISVPLNATGLSTSTKYHIVINGTTSTSNYCEFDDGTTVTNAALTSSNGTSWSSAGKSLVFTTYAGINGVVRHIWEDNGAHWTSFTYAMGSAGTAGPPTTTREYTTSSLTTVGRQQRTLAYSSGILSTIT